MKKQVHVVGAVIVNEANEIFCAKRSSEMTLANYWEFPGGKIEAGESAPHALKREIAEELACTIEVFGEVEDTIYEYDAIIVRLQTYMAKIIDGEPIAQEHAEIRWVPVNQLATLEWAPADIPAVHKIMKGE